MGIEITLAVVFVGFLIFAAYLFAEFFRSKNIPDVLLLIIIGLVVGPITGLLNQSMFGHIGSVFSNITLVIILFEGGTNLKAEIIKQALRGTAKITLINFLTSTFLTGFITYYFFDFDPILSFMLGAFLGGTASAIIIPMVAQLKMASNSKTILVLESAVTDVLCVVVGLAFFEAFKLGEVKLFSLFGSLVSGFLFSIILGFLGGLVWSFLLNKVRSINNSIFTTPAFVFIMFGISELLGFNGAITALIFGITLANIELLPLNQIQKYTRFTPNSLNETEKVFFAEVVFLLKTFFFVYIGISIVLTDYFSLSIGLLLTCVYYFIRVFIVNISVSNRIPKPDRIIMSMMVPKGLAAAVLASLPYQAGIEGGELIQNITYSAVLFSIVANSLLIFANSRVPAVRAVYGLFFKS
ncbi:MAG: cation:proton antiporter [Bacteroidetes bacterium]|nr:cation:proton antiporter [Bacteroidota bacterium]